MHNINAISVRGNRLYILGLRQSSTAFAVAVFDLPTLRLAQTFAQPAQFIAADPTGRWLAAVVPSASEVRRTSYDIVVWNIASGEEKVLARGLAGYTSTICWHPGGEALTFDGVDRWITSVAVSDGSRTRIIEGEAPAWSPDGSALCYRRGRVVFVRTAAAGTSRQLGRRFFWQSGFAGSMYWSPDGKYILVNASAGPTGEELTGIVFEASSGKQYVLYRGAYWCGPWFDARAPDHY